MSLTFEERLAEATAPRKRPCVVCDAIRALTPVQQRALEAAELKHASQLARVLDVGETSVKRHRGEGHNALL